jgi:HPt (histidine-containing phosphotransfer) domain-containing protein
MALEKEEGIGMKQVLWLCIFFVFFPVIAFADSSALIIQGVAGSEDHEKKFEKWATGTRDVLVQDLGFSKDRVILLAGDATKKESIQKTFEQLKQQVKAQDTFLLFLIGHGSFDTDFKLGITGVDLTGAEYSKLIDSLNPGRTIIVCSSPSSGGMFDTLKGKNRILVAASRSGEKEDTVFYEHFLAGLKGIAADEDKDKKVSVWEAFRYASAAVDRYYKEKTIIMTEHSGLEAAGAPQVAATVAEQDAPVLARVTPLNADRDVTVADPKLQALLNEKKSIDMRIEKLRLDKGLLSEAEYQRQLEDLILDLAKKNQEIQEQQKK